MCPPNFRNINLVRYFDASAASTPSAASPSVYSPRMLLDGQETMFGRESGSSKKRQERTDTILALSSAMSSSCSISSNLQVSSSYAISSQLLEHQGSTRSEFRNRFEDPIASNKSENRPLESFLGNFGARGPSLSLLEEFRETKCTPPRNSPRAPQKAKSDLSGHRLSFTNSAQSKPISNAEAMSPSVTRPPANNRAPLVRLVKIPSTRQSFEDLAEIQKCGKESIPTISHASVHGANQVSRILAKGVSKSVVFKMDSKDSSTQNTPVMRSTVAGHAHPKTLSQIGQNTVTFSPSRSNLKAELGIIRRTGDIVVEKKDPCDSIQDGDVDFGSMSFQSMCSSSYSQESHFKTVTLLQGSVSQWFTGQSRERSTRALPPIFEEDEPFGDDVDDLQEDSF